MFQQPKDQQREPNHSQRSPMEEVIRQLQKAWEHEIADPHKNNGQKDHKCEHKQSLWAHGQQKHVRNLE